MSTRGRQDLTTRGRRSIRGPEIAELRAFCAAVDLGTLGKAAVSLKISQPALSKRLRALEAAAGAKLLERSRRGVVPTAAGRRLYPEARRLLEQADVVERVLESAPREEAPIELAVSHTIAEFFLAPELVAYQADGRRPSVQLTIANSGAVRRMVAEGRASIGIAAAGPEGQDGADESRGARAAGGRGGRWRCRRTTPGTGASESRRSSSSPPRWSCATRTPTSAARVEAELAERGLTLADPLIEAATHGGGEARGAAALRAGAALLPLAERGARPPLPAAGGGAPVPEAVRGRLPVARLTRARGSRFRRLHPSTQARTIPDS